MALYSMMLYGRPCIRRLQCIRRSSTQASSRILSTVRDDLKTAMRAKDTARLDVLRGLLSDVTNAKKANTPAESDADIIQLIRKRIKVSKGAALEAEKAQRPDLSDKEEFQIRTLEQYVSSSGALSSETIAEIVTIKVKELFPNGKGGNKGALMKALVGPGGAFEGQVVERKTVAEKVDEALAAIG